MSTIKRWSFLTHRWLGILLGLFFFIWFLSGMAMVYSGVPAPTPEMRAAHAQPLHAEAQLLDAGEAWMRAQAAIQAFDHEHPPITTMRHGGMGGGMHGTGGHAHGDGQPGLMEARLVMQAGEPVWLVRDGRGRRYALSAVDGGLRPADEARALALVHAWFGTEGGRATALGSLTTDTVTRMGHHDPYRPFLLIALNDEADTRVHVSERTGEIVRITTRVDRVLQTFGGWLHFLRPLDAIGLSQWRSDILMWSALAGVVMTMFGIVVGLLVFRPGWFGRSRYQSGRVQPFREGWARWHFWLGMTAGALTLAWILSGFLATNPGKVFSSATLNAAELKAYRGGSLAWAGGADTCVPGPVLAQGGAAWTELSWVRLGDGMALLGTTPDARRAVLCRRGQAGAGPVGFDEGELVAAARRVMPVEGVKTVEWLREYDNHYYLGHHRSPADRPLPVLKVELDDAQSTRLYLDPISGEPLLRADASRRAYRWLFNAMHSWDFGMLHPRPVWDAWIVFWGVAGLLLSLTSLVIGVRRVMYGLRRRRRHEGETMRTVAGSGNL